MVLGCHDLTMFNPRARATAVGWRSEALQRFVRLTRDHRPSVVLHHPHSTVKPGTWRNGWNGVKAELGSALRSFAGAGRYAADDRGWPTRRPIDEVLAATASADCIDIVAEPALK